MSEQHHLVVAERDALRAQILCAPEFLVNAGKLDYDGERKYKYCDSFTDFNEALNAYESTEGYAFRELLLKQRHLTHTLVSV